MEGRIARLLELAEARDASEAGAHDVVAEPVRFATRLPQIVRSPRWHLSGVWY